MQQKETSGSIKLIAVLNIKHLFFFGIKHQNLVIMQRLKIYLFRYTYETRLQHDKLNLL